MGCPGSHKGELSRVRVLIYTGCEGYGDDPCISFAGGFIVNSEGEQLRFPSSDGRLNSIEAPCLPFSAGFEPAPCDQGAIPPWNPRLICFPVPSHGACDKSVKSVFFDILRRKMTDALKAQPALDSMSEEVNICA
jgi:hypothetical protein